MSDQPEGQAENKDPADQARLAPEPALPIAEPDSVSSKQPLEPTSQQVKVLELLRTELSAELYSGPLPHPDILAKLDHIIPGSAKRMLLMAENQSKHRQELERLVLTEDVARSRVGLWTGFTIGMTGLLGSILLGILGRTIEACFLGGATLISLVGVFVLGTKRRQEVRDEKAQLLAGIRLPQKSKPPSAEERSGG